MTVTRKPKILVVEDERVVATDIEDCLNKLGYAVVGAAASGPGAIRCAVETAPDLVLMDIKLKGAMDGVDAAGELHGRLGIPVVFLTAYADGEILERAKKASPSGYVLKPFDERALRSAVELALDRHPKERQLAESERRLVTALRGLSEAVILTRGDGRIAFMNRAAERLSGWKQSDAAGRRFRDVFATIHGRMGSLVRDPVARVLREGVTLGLGEHTLLLSKYGSETWIQGSASPLCDEDGGVVGAAVVFHPASAAGDAAGVASADLPEDRWRTLNRLACGVMESLVRMLDTVPSASGPETDTAAAAESAAPCDTAEKVRGLAGRFLAVARPRVPAACLVNVGELVRESGDLLSCVAGQGVAIETRPGAGTGEASVDPVVVQQVLLDLVAGWRRRIPLGGTITMETADVELLDEYARSCTSLAPGRYVVVSVNFAGALILGPGENFRQEMPSVCESLKELGGDVVVDYEPGRRVVCEIYLQRPGDGDGTRS